MTITKRDRYRGATVGTLCGDAYGAPYEWTWHPTAIKADIENRGGLVPHEYEPFDYIEPWKKKRVVLKGHPTDDSELAAALALSLIEKPNFDPAHTYYRLRDFIHGNTPAGRRSILTDVAYGEGSTLKAALLPKTYEESVAKFSVGEMPTPPSNGSLMRCVAAPLRRPHDPEAAWELGVAQSHVTHRHESAKAACGAYSYFVSLLLNGESMEKAWIETRQYMWSRGKDDALTELMEMNIRDAPDFRTDIEPQKGYVILSLRAALWASIEARDFADGIVRVIKLGGDTDTYAAIAGGILGAHFGIQGIPKKWVESLQGCEKMIEIADQLYELAHS